MATLTCSVWLRQLRLLLWKNYTLRKRHWIRCLVELTIPLFMFLLLALMRSSVDPRELHGYCHFEEKALPSGGVLPLMQNYLCTYNNTCHEGDPVSKFHPIFNYPDTAIYYGELNKEFEMLRENWTADSSANMTSFESIASKICGTVPGANLMLQKSERTYETRDDPASNANECKQILLQHLPHLLVNYLWDDLVSLMRGKILFSPDNNVTRAVVGHANETFETVDSLRQDLSKLNSSLTPMDPMVNMTLAVLNCFDLNKYVPVEDEVNLVRMAQDLMEKQRFFGAIVFEMDTSNLTLTSHVRYKIRMSVDKIRSRPHMKGSYRPAPRRDPQELQYLYSGFMWLQDMIERAIIRTIIRTHVNDSKIELPSATLKQMPSPCYFEDNFVFAIVSFFPFIMVMSFLFPTMSLVKKIVTEKERRLQETMRIMGMQNSAYWSAWFLESFLSWSLPAIGIVIILKVGNLLYNGDLFVIYLLLTTYIIATISLCFLISTLFNRASLASFASSVIFIFSYFIKTGLMRWEDQVNIHVGVKVLMCLISNVAFTDACVLVNYERSGQGVQWSDVPVVLPGGSPVSIAGCMGMLLLDAVIYMLLALYVQATFPGKFGQGKPFCFCLQSKHCRNASCQSSKRESREPTPNPEVQPRPESLKAGVSVRRVSKQYGSHVVVSDLSISFYEGNITTILGYNGAGKTTLMSMIVGMIPTSSGHIYVEGCDMAKDPEGARTHIGYCPQQDNLFLELSVIEHLQFYSDMKSTYESQKSQIEDMLQETGLDASRDKLSRQLSGGMKRKLSILIAFLGGTSVIVMDEPTAGVDPLSRRDILRLLNARRDFHTIIMSTHIMEEADMSDRIVIVHEGRLLCAGSPMFLKQHYGTGYKLTVALDVSEKAKTDVLNFIKRFVPAAHPVSESNLEVEYLLPKITEDYEGSLAKMFYSLENDKSSLHVKSYGISAAELEEVFLIATNKTLPTTGNPPQFEDNVNSDGLQTPPNIWKLWARIVYALMVKRFHFFKRDFRGLIFEILLPLGIVLFVVVIVNVSLKITPLEPRPLELNTWMLQKEDSQDSNELFYSQNFDANSKAILNRMKIAMFSNSSYGTACISGRCDGKGSPDLEAFGRPTKVGNLSEYCLCSSGKQQCQDTSGLVPPSTRLHSGDLIYNLTDWNVTDFLLLTDQRSHGKRYGGYEFLKETAFDSLMNSTQMSGNIRVWFNSKGGGAVAVFVNAINNVLLRSIIQNKTANYEQYGISVVNHPILSKNETDNIISGYQSYAFLEVLSVMLAMSLVSASFATFYVEERSLKVKQLQYLAGVHPTAYWTAALLWDMTLFLFTTLLCIAIFAMFDLDHFVSQQNTGPLILLFLLYGWSSLNLTHLSSFFFTNKTTAMVINACFYLIVGYVTTITTLVLEASRIKHLEDTAKILKPLFLVLPQYCFGRGLMDLSEESIKNKALETLGLTTRRDRFEWTFLGQIFLSLTLQGFAFLILTLLLDWRKVNCPTPAFFSCCRKKADRSTSTAPEDSEVLKERERVLGQEVDDVLVVRELNKYYGNKPAVRYLNFGVQKGECFGLVGANGAGKSTTMKILTGDLSATSGTAVLMGEELQKSSCRGKIGYCPQEDALSPLLTVREHLTFYHRVHNYPEADLEKLINASMTSMALEDFADTLADGLSGGTKRKLQMCIAVMGDPCILMLDEPSTGMDALARSYLLKNIERCSQRGQAIIVVSHNMQECDAFCTRIAVMKNGRFLCLGSPQRLKEKYGASYIITLRLVKDSEEAKDEMKRLVSKKFGQEAKYLDGGFSQLKYAIPLHTTKLNTIFTRLESIRKESSNLEDYIVSQVSLNEVFLNEMTNQP